MCQGKPNFAVVRREGYSEKVTIEADTLEELCDALAEKTGRPR